jgi:prokaryotic ubiquitin-like protein Pup
MPGQERAPQSHNEDNEPEAQVEAKDLTNTELNEDIDSMLDEIDGVLESNAEDFVRSFVQKGGQ